MRGPLLFMDKKNYLWIAIAVMAVAITAILLLMNDKKEGTDVKNVPNNTNTVENTVPTTTPNIQALDALPFSEETILSVDGESMTPKTIRVKANQKVFLTFSAKDDARHTFNFIDEDLSFILVVFSKAEGDKSISFPMVKAGTYTYYVDNKDNTGQLIVE